MQKFNSQKGTVEISTAAAMAIIAAIVAAVSICSTVLYFDIINAPVPVTAVNPEPKPTAAPTPSTDETANWKVISSATEGYELKYPADLNLGRNLPPRVIIDDKDMPELSEGIIKNVTETTVNGINFIVIVSEGAAAGSTYPDYFYKTEHDGKSFTIYFPVRYPTDCKTYAASADQTKCETFKTGLDG